MDEYTTGVQFTLEDALKETCHLAVSKYALAKGLRECVKALESRKAKLCILSEENANTEYVSLITALCKEHKVNLIKVDDSIKLGTWTMQYEIDKNGMPRKIIKCGCAVVKEIDEEYPHLEMIAERIN